MDPYMTTYSGVKFSLSTPRPEDVRLWDIGWALSRIPHFNGCTQDTWTVAEHSLYTLEVFDHLSPKGLPQDRLYALLHDAHEAYIGDIITPVGVILGSRTLRALKSVVQGAIHLAFLPTEHSIPVSPLVEEADHIALRMEAEHFMVHPEAIAPFQEVDVRGAPPPIHSILGGRTDFVRRVLDLRGKVIEGVQ